MPHLTPDEISFFKREGYLIKRGAMDPELTARTQDRLWAGIPPRFRRDDAETWTGPFRKDEESRDSSSVRGGFMWKYREPGSEEWIIKMLVTNQPIWSWAEQLLGKGEVVDPFNSRPGQGAPPPDRIRGIYSKLPEGDIPEEPTTCHTDAGFFHLGIVGLIDQVPARGGAFTVWPKSHRTFYYAFTSQYRHERVEGYDKHVEYFDTQPPVDCHGGPGDIVFWHHRLAHTAGHNRSRQIRQAVLYDFRKKDIEQTVDEPPQKDMWRDWSEEVRAAPI
jgi:hypothetical protein